MYPMSDSITSERNLSISNYIETNEKNYLIIISASMMPDVDDNDHIICVNRQSSKNNVHGHIAKKSVLRKAHEKLAPNKPFTSYHITESGNLKHLRNVVDADNVREAVRDTEFGELMDILDYEIGNTHGKLYVLIFSIDRLFRPSRYRSNKGTWNYSPDDFAAFKRLLDACFGKRSDDITFVPICEGTPEEIRSQQIKLGMKVSGNPGGRPSAIQKSYRVKPLLNDEAVELARKYNWNANQIVRFFEKKYKRRFIDRTIRNWLKDEGVPSPRGRPKGNRKTES